MRLKVIAGITGHDTRVVDRETGELLEGVTEVAWSVGVNGYAVLTLSLMRVPIETAPLAEVRDGARDARSA